MSSCGYGCYIGNAFMGAVAYADDIVLLSPTLYGLRKMLKVCESFSNNYDIEFNPSKSKMLLFNAPDVLHPLKMNGTVIPVSKCEKHLGNIIGQDSNVKRVENAVKELYCSCNKIVNEFNLVDLNTRYFLFKTYCTSFYGSPLFYYESDVIDRVSKAWRNSIRHLLKLPRKTHSNLIHRIVDDIPIIVQLHKRMLKFVKSCLKGNALCTLAIKLALDGSHSIMCRNINFVCEEYGLNKLKFDKQMYTNVSFDSQDNLLDMKVGSILDFISFRDTLTLNSSDYSNLNEIIAHLCED